jgi:glutathione reductase (NADPH)
VAADVSRLTEAYTRRGIRIVTGAAIAAIEKHAGGLDLKLRNGQAIGADQIMLAIGREPNTAGLGLEAAGVTVGRRGEIAVDQYSRSSVAISTPAMSPPGQLTPVAIREGAFADTEFGDRPTRVDHTRSRPPCLTPEIGTVGLSESHARDAGHRLDIYKSNFRPMKAPLSGATDRTIMKLVVDADTQKVLGVHILGPDAGEIVQVAAIALKLGATKADFDATVALHPSAAEELVTMREKWQPPTA